MKYLQFLPFIFNATNLLIANDPSPVQKQDTMREITPDAGPRVQNGADLFVVADFIYWTARQDGLIFSRSKYVDFTSDVIPTSLSEGSTGVPCDQFDPGFKIGLGLDFNHDGWDSLLNYTWFHSSQLTTQHNVQALWLDTAAALSGGDIIDLQLINYDLAQARWNIKFNNFDWELGRNFFISPSLKLRPQFGLKGGWYSQHFNTTYAIDFDASNSLNMSMRQKQSYWWLGLRGGLDGAFQFSNNWSLFGSTAVSANWGHYQVYRKDTENVVSDDTAFTLPFFANRSAFHTTKGALEMQLGLRYEYFWSNDEYHFSIDAAWEGQVWFNQNQFIRVDIPSLAGDLSFQGLTLSFRLDF